MDFDFKGMTVNERLWVSGLMEEFEVAIEQKNTNTAIQILQKVGLTMENIEPILRKHGLVN